MTEPNLENRLQRYFDEELPSAEADELRAQIEQDEELQAKLDGLAQLRTLLQAALAPEHLEAPDGDGLFAAIEAKVATDEDASDDALFPAAEVLEDELPVAEAPEAEAPEAEQAAPRLRVLDGGKSEEPVVATPVTPSSGRPMWIGVTAFGLAAAAAILFFVLRPGENGTNPDGEPEPIAIAAPPPGSEIEQIDFGHSTGAIFQVEDEGAEYAVVWISDEKPPELVPPTNPDENQDRIQ